jgi:4-hydroxybenzoate-CoA ligase
VAGADGPRSLAACLAPGAAPPVDSHADEVAFWLYSSGSTNAPKGVRHVHGSLYATVETYADQVLKIRETDVVYSAAKMFFAYGLGNAMTFPMSAGATTVLLPHRPTPAAVIALMRQHDPSIFCGVPTLYAAMLQHPEIGPGAGSKNLRRCISAGEALPEHIGLAWKNVVGTDILDGIGSTEMLHIFLSNTDEALKYGTSGVAVPGYELKIVDGAGDPAPDGEPGELLVKGASAAEGYWNQREKSRRTFVGEWTYTGDKYIRDADGFYRYCGRTDDMFKVSGIWVSPFEVEAALASHEQVLEAAVVGHEDADGLVKPRAFVVLKRPAKDAVALIAALQLYVKLKIGPWKYPRWIEIVEDLPKTATGKIQRFKLRQVA